MAADLARAENARYVVTASPQAFPGQWKSDRGVWPFAFGPAPHRRGDEVKVFEVVGER